MQLKRLKMINVSRSCRFRRYPVLQPVLGEDHHFPGVDPAQLAHVSTEKAPTPSHVDLPKSLQVIQQQAAIELAGYPRRRRRRRPRGSGSMETERVLGHALLVRDLLHHRLLRRCALRVPGELGLFRRAVLCFRQLHHHRLRRLRQRAKAKLSPRTLV